MPLLYQQERSRCWWRGGGSRVGRLHRELWSPFVGRLPCSRGERNPSFLCVCALSLLSNLLSVSGYNQLEVVHCVCKSILLLEHVVPHMYLISLFLKLPVSVTIWKWPLLLVSTATVPLQFGWKLFPGLSLGTSMITEVFHHLYSIFLGTKFDSRVN